MTTTMDTYRASSAALTGWQHVIPHLYAMRSQVVEVCTLTDSHGDLGSKICVSLAGGSTGLTAPTNYGDCWGVHRALRNLGIPCAAGPMLSPGFNDVGGADFPHVQSTKGSAAGGTAIGTGAPGSTLGPMFNSFGASGGFCHTYRAVPDNTSWTVTSNNGPTMTIIMSGVGYNSAAGIGDFQALDDTWTTDSLDLTLQLQRGSFVTANYTGTGSYTPRVRYGDSPFSALTTSPPSASTSNMGAVGSDALVWDEWTLPFANWSPNTQNVFEFQMGGGAAIAGPYLLGYFRVVPKARTAGFGGVTMFYRRGGFTAGQIYNDASTGLTQITNAAGDNFWDSLFHRADQLGQPRKLICFVNVGTNDCGVPTSAAQFKTDVGNMLDQAKAGMARRNVDVRFVVRMGHPIHDSPANNGNGDDPTREYWARQYLTQLDSLASTRGDMCHWNWNTAGWTRRRLGQIFGYIGAVSLTPQILVNPNTGSDITSSYHLSRWGYEALALDLLGGLMARTSARYGTAPRRRRGR